jgi:hypothetical protein
VGYNLKEDVWLPYIFGVKRRSLEIAILPPLIHFAAFSAGSNHLKKSSGGPKGLIGPPCHGEERK